MELDTIEASSQRKWHVSAKIYCTYIPSIVGFLVCFASTSTVPAEAQLRAAFQVSARVSQLPFSLFILGLGFGPMIAAPISEDYGRKPVYLLSIPIFSAFVLGAGLSRTFISLVVCRFIAGAFGGSALVVGFGMLADVWDASELPIALSIFNTVPFCGPAAGQLVSSYIVPQKSWRWTQWTTLFLAAFTYLTVLPMYETYPLSIIKKRQKFGAGSPEAEKKSVKQRMKAGMARIPFIRPLRMLVREPVVALFALYIAFNFAVVYCFSASVPFTFRTQYGFDLQSQGLVFISLIVGYILSAPFMIIPYFIQKRHRQIQELNSTGSKEIRPPLPERLLWPALYGSVVLPLSFFWFGWSAYRRVHWICPCLALGLFSWGNNLIYNASQLYLLEVYGPKYGASATAANNLLRYIFAAILPLCMDQMYTDLGVNWAASLLGFILCLFLPIPWAFRRFGTWLRARSFYTSRGNPTQSSSSELILEQQEA